MNACSSKVRAPGDEGFELLFGERYSSAALYSFAGAIASRSLIFLQGILVARHLAVELFGLFSIVTVVTGLITSFSGFGLGSALIRSLPECLAHEPQRAGSLVGHCLVAAAFSVLATGTAFFLGAPLLAHNLYHRADLVAYFRISVFIVVALALSNMAGSILIAFQKFRDYAWQLSVGYGLQFVAVWVGVCYFGLRGALVGLLVGSLASMLMAFRVAGGVVSEVAATVGWNKWRWSWSVMRSILNFSIPAQMSGYIATPLLWAGSTLLALKKGFVEVGLFSVAFVFYQAVLFAPQNLSLPALPLLSEIQATGNWTRFNYFLSKNLRAMWAMTLPVCFILVALGRPLVVLLYGREYAAAGRLVFYLSFTALLFMIAHTKFVAMMSVNRMWEAFAFYTFWSATVLVLAWCWIPAHGSAGLAGSYLASCLILAVVLALYTKRRLQFRFGENLRVTVLTLAAAGLTYLGVFCLPNPSVLLTLLCPFLVWAEWKWVFEDEDRSLVRTILSTAMNRVSLGSRKIATWETR